MLFFNSELQVEDCDVTEDLQIQPMHQSCKFITHHAPLRFLSNILLSSRRTGFWFQFYFPFFEGFCLFLVLFYRIQDLKISPIPQLVNIRLDGLICWMVGSNSVVQVHSALVGQPGDVMSIEHPDDGLFPESFPVIDVLRWGLDNTRLTIPWEWCQYSYASRSINVPSFFSLMLVTSALIDTRVCVQVYNDDIFCI